MDCSTTDSRFHRLVEASAFEPGDEVEALGPTGCIIRGRIVETALHLEVIWVRESGTNDRKLLDLDDFIIRPLNPETANQAGSGPAGPA